MADVTVQTAPPDDRPARVVVAILVWAQAVLGAQMPVHFILGGLVGQTLAPDPAYATLPISTTVLVTMFAAPAISTFMGRYGRRAGFLVGAVAGVVAAALATHAIAEQDFALFCAASGILGIYMGAHGMYRFAATDIASPAFQPKAISWVLAGGLAAAIIGPQIVKEFEDWLEPIPFAGAYQAMAILGLLGMVPLAFLRIPLPKKSGTDTGPSRPWSEILRDRRIIVAMICGMISYALMNLMMTSTPLAMIACGFDTADASDVVRIHVLLMFLPSFFTGSLIARYGAVPIMGLGMVILVASSLVALAGISLTHFNIALGLLGVGWNFGFIGATAMLANAHRPEERSKVQGMNDFLVFGLVTVASFSSGALMDGLGWSAVSLAMLPALAVAAATLVWISRKGRYASPSDPV